MGRQKRQAGFSIVEAVIVVVAAAVIGTAGFFVYQHNKPKRTDAATGNNQTTNNQQPGITNTTPTTAYFTISEWGVRAPYSGSLKISYTMSADGKTATFSSDQLTALSTDCTGYGGSIVRYSPTDFVSPYQQGQTVEQVATQNPGRYGHVGSYYYIFAHAQSGCGDISSTASLQSQTNDAVKVLSMSLQAIPKN